MLQEGACASRKPLYTRLEVVANDDVVIRRFYVLTSEPRGTDQERVQVLTNGQTLNNPNLPALAGNFLAGPHCGYTI
jgi:hypothetical protein